MRQTKMIHTSYGHIWHPNTDLNKGIIHWTDCVFLPNKTLVRIKFPTLNYNNLDATHTARFYGSPQLNNNRVGRIFHCSTIETNQKAVLIVMGNIDTKTITLGMRGAPQCPTEREAEAFIITKINSLSMFNYDDVYCEVLKKTKENIKLSKLFRDKHQHFDYDVSDVMMLTHLSCQELTPLRNKGFLLNDEIDGKINKCFTSAQQLCCLDEYGNAYHWQKPLNKQYIVAPESVKYNRTIVPLTLMGSSVSKQSSTKCEDYNIKHPQRHKIYTMLRNYNMSLTELVGWLVFIVSLCVTGLFQEKLIAWFICICVWNMVRISIRKKKRRGL